MQTTESAGLCTFCGKPVALHVRGERVTPAGGQVSAQAEGDDRAAAAMALKERLVEYDRNSAQRTTVVDDQVRLVCGWNRDCWL